MKRIALVWPTALLFLLALSVSDPVLAKKGGGYSEDGVLYHSHSSRSYSGKNNFKGKGQAKGYGKTKNKNKGAKNASGVNDAIPQ